MGTCLRVIGVILLISLAVIYQVYINLSHPYPVPKLDLKQYWGPGNKPNHKDDLTIFPSKIRFPEEQIIDLKKRLNRSLDYLHEPLEGINFEYGFNSRYLKKVIKYWRDDYMPRWREREIYLWRFPHLTTEIQGLNIHFIQTRLDEKVKKTKKVYPVLLLHGWPGSVREFYDIIPKLTESNPDTEYVFEVVAPSLPGYGWSQAASKPGFGPVQMAVVLRNLMIRLGHDKFFIQGGDWGSLIGSNIAALFPDNVIGHHSTMCGSSTELAAVKLMIAKFLPKLFIDKEYHDFYFPMGEKMSNLIEETGYMHIQATKPDTIGIALSDNPIGLAAYILEKFSTWSNLKNRKLIDAGLDKDIKMDSLLDNIMIYYLTNSITTSQRLYAEAFTREQRALHIDRVPVQPPVGCARFKHDLVHSFDWQLEEKYPNLIHSTYHKTGGHFAAMEVPNILYKDFITFVKKVIEKPKPKVIEKVKVTEKAKVTEKSTPKQDTKSKINNKK